MSDYLSQIDFCIKAHRLRPQAERNLVASIRQFYPDAAITINRDDELHTGRNALVKVTERPFLLFLDDDFVFTKETRIEVLFGEMADIEIGIAAGIVLNNNGNTRVVRHSGGSVYIADRACRVVSRIPGLMVSKYIDIAPNFILVRRSVFMTSKWRFGIGAEHADFFLQVRDAGWKVVQIDECRIDHDLLAGQDHAYKRHRWDHELIARNMLAFMDQWGIDRIIDNGKLVHSRPMEVVR